MFSHNNSGIQKRFILSIALTSLILVAEVIGGIISGSLALLSDAAHVFSDVFALGLSFFALRLATRPPDDQHSYGWHRAEVLAALVNGVTLIVIAIGIWVEAVKRWQAPQEVRSTEMLVIAILGLVVNLVVAVILGRGEHTHNHEHDGANGKERNLNVHSAFLHVVGDSISSAGVILAAIVIHFTSAYWIDPLVSMLIGAIILVGAYRVTRKSLHILNEGVPEGLSTEKVNQSIRSIPGVQEVHDLHIWNLCSEHVSLSAHVVVKDEIGETDPQLMSKIKSQLDQEFGIAHTTIQFEITPCESGHGGCN